MLVLLEQRNTYMSSNIQKVDPYELFEYNQKLIYFVMHKYYPTTLNNEDFMQDAYLGLWKACITFDPSKSIQFTTYAVSCIKNELRYTFKKMSRQVDTVSIQAIEDAMKESGIDDPTFQIEDPTADETGAVEYLSELTDKERDLVVLAMNGLKQTEIAKREGVSRQRISTIFKKIKSRLLN